MGRGVSAGGGQSSLGYLFGSGEATNTPQAAQYQGKGSSSHPASKPTAAPQQGKGSSSDPASKPSAVPQPAEPNKPAGILSSATNNYLRADGQNCGNFLTERPSTKVHAAPGGGSSLDYLFGGGSK